MASRSLFAACCTACCALTFAVRIHQQEAGPSFTVSREINAPEGNSIQFHIEPGCKINDAHGENWCEIPWGSKVTFASIADLAEPVHRGDVVRFTGDAWFKASDTAPLLAQSLFTGVKLKAVHECGLCAGKCNIMATSDHGFKSVITTPTFVSRPGACKALDEQMPKRVSLGTFTFQTPDVPDPAWDLSSAMNFNLALTSADGQERASEDIHMRLDPRGMRASLLAVDAAAGVKKTGTSLSETLGALALMAETSGRVDAMARGLEGRPQSSGGLISFWSAVGGLLKDSVTQASSVKRSRQDLSLMRFQLSFKNMKSTKGQKPLTLVASEDRADGMVEDCTTGLCKFPLGKKTNISGQAGVKYTLPPGSFVNLKMNLVFKGDQGKAMQPFVEPIQKMFPIKLPACGDRDEEVKANMANGKEFIYSPPPCGDYTFEVLSPATNIFLPLISRSASPMPEVPFFGFVKQAFPFDLKNMELPPFLATINLDAYHADGQIPIANVEFKFGLE